ncbi:hypothetical protein DICPUDRAFT_159260 [Dictyostelium purpureum]|uniref:FYVE-type domain-containing protein n=1 Tax=Dictyostelium purpureum TaxID=5786 RepID=F1A3N9_DICPU|nr:uncharacterized protein DICPUDRAFT_159260 [Dictyostelium purpureum]EGC29190.1 hypothetical protein DICPUDRAFT_159260 [Dictyostelium purpureum]|eukprot:XP_003294285.1 hypothetical protein DICPUDRAFT_159260 [Dictyostelium purpureum]
MSDPLIQEGEEEDFVSPFARTENLPKTTAPTSTLSYPTSDETSEKKQEEHQQEENQTTTVTNTEEPKKKKPSQPQKEIQQNTEQQEQEQEQHQQQQQQQQQPPVASRKPTWVPDNHSNKCEMCSVPFTFLNRRHHCRRCGHLFCGSCCSLNTSLPQEFGYTTRVKVCSKCFTTTINERALEETTHTINIGGVSKETKVVSGVHKVLLWKMGAHEDGDFNRDIIDSIENAPSTPIPVSRVQDLYLDPSVLDVEGCTGFRVRVYNPALDPGEKPSIYPILMWFHSGGFVSKSIETPSIDGLCRLLSNQAKCVVISVDYRLAPEHMFPAAALDCFAATCWAVKKASTFDGDPTRVAVAGDSCGGNLAAAVALMARDKETPRLCGQVLICPILDLKRNEDKYYTRVVHNDGYLMPMSYFRWFSSKYCKETDVDNPYASPIRAATTTKALCGLPVSHVITAGHDPFMDEGELYIKKLRQSNVKVYHTRYTNSTNAFFGIGLDESNEAVMEVSIILKYMFGVKRN